MRAFRSDAALKAEVMVRLEHGFATGAIREGGTGWHNGQGSLVGALLHDGDLDRVSARLELPRDVLALLDHAGSHIYFTRVPRIETARRFMAACALGADLTPVVPALLARLRRGLVDADGEDGVDRTAILAAIDAPAGAPDAVVAIVDQWLELQAKVTVSRAGWSEAQEARAQAALQQLWNATRDRRRQGDWPDYPAMFRQSDPELAAGYERALQLLNASYDVNARDLVDLFIGIVGSIVPNHAAEPAA